MKIPPVGAELFQADGWTDRRERRLVFRSFTEVLKHDRTDLSIYGSIKLSLLATHANVDVEEQPHLFLT